ncbi:MAG: phosphoribosylamine--glycine ligase [Treponema sp.]|nr:phosphoribosylamine--glycine ligase [Treponema sp.]
MKILVVGSGGREHALAWKLAQSEKVQRVFVAPGNGGTQAEARCENVPMTADPASAGGQEELKQFALREKVDLTVIGPEVPLAGGIADTFRGAGLAIIGPGRQAAQLESSKIYSKAFMAKYGVRAAKSSNFTDFDKARAFAAEHFSFGAGESAGSCAAAGALGQLVIKADGLAAGKGVIIAQDFAEAEAALASLMRDKSLGDAGDSVLLEEFLAGTEVSVMAAVSVADGKGYILPFISARDHKRRFEGARGPNTGGMGAIAPVPDFSQTAQNDFARSIVEPTLRGMIAEGLEYCGFIFFGVMVHDERCYLLEYNVRLGDPETQALVPLMDFDLVDLCAAMLAGKDFSLKWKPGAVCAPVAVADGYPGPYRKGDAIAIDAAALEAAGAKAFIAGAAADGAASLRTTGGRVLAVSAYGPNADAAYAAAYRGMAAIRFDGMGYRTDIGKEIIR